MTREEKLKVLGAKPLEWKFGGMREFSLYDEAVSTNPYTQEELRYEIETKKIQDEDYRAFLRLEREGVVYLLADARSIDSPPAEKLKEKAESDFYDRIVKSAKEAGINAPIFEEEGAVGDHTTTSAESLLSEVTPLKWEGEEDDTKCDLSARIVLIDEEYEDEDDALAIEFEIDSNKKHGFCSLYVKASGKWELGYYNIINSRGYNIPIDELKAKAEEVRLSMAKRFLGIKK